MVSGNRRWQVLTTIATVLVIIVCLLFLWSFIANL